jgi:hypothetical protein
MIAARLFAPDFMSKPRSGLVLNAQFEQDRPPLFEHACALGCERCHCPTLHAAWFCTPKNWGSAEAGRLSRN